MGADEWVSNEWVQGASEECVVQREADERCEVYCADAQICRCCAATLPHQVHPCKLPLGNKGTDAMCQQAAHMMQTATEVATI